MLRILALSCLVFPPLSPPLCDSRAQEAPGGVIKDEGCSQRLGWLQAVKFPNCVVAAVEACKRGVVRAHLVDARIPGGLQLELYSRDGVGTMISTDI
jgi:hypothetical protein